MGRNIRLKQEGVTPFVLLLNSNEKFIDINLVNLLLSSYGMIWYGMSLPLVTPTQNQSSTFSRELLKVLTDLS